MVNNNLSFDECKQMSRRLIAMNPNRNANMGKISTHLLDYYTELTKQPWLCTLVGQIRDLTAKQKQMLQQAAEAVDAAQYQNEDDLAFAIIKKQEEVKAGETFKQLDKQISALKKQLPFRSPHYFHFLDDHRAQKTIDPDAFTFQTTVDIDNPEEVETAVKNALLLNGMFDAQQEKLFREKIFSLAALRTSASSSTPMQRARSILLQTGTSDWMRKPWLPIVRLTEREDWTSTAVRWILIRLQP